MGDKTRMMLLAGGLLLPLLGGCADLAVGLAAHAAADGFGLAARTMAQNTPKGSAPTSLAPPANKQPIPLPPPPPGDPAAKPWRKPVNWRTVT